MSSFDAVFFDVDGVLCHGENPIPHAVSAVEQCRAQGLQIRIVSNNSLVDHPTLVRRLQSAGFPFEADEVYLASRLLARYLMEKTPRATIFLLGSDAVQRELEKQGLRVLDEPEEIAYLCDYVVTATDVNFSYNRLTKAWRCLQMGANLVSVEQDPIYPIDDEETLPAGGPVAAAVAALQGRPAAYLAGKPSPHLLLAAAESCGLAPHRCLFVGDSLTSDLQAAAAANMPCAITLTGATRRSQAEKAEPAPFAILEDLRDLLSVLSSSSS